MSGSVYALNNVDPLTYVNLIGSFYQQQPNFIATVHATTDPYVALENFIQSMIPSYNLNSAIGAQLDVLGTIIGISRYITTPVTGVYFSLGVLGLGLGQGYLQGFFDPSEGLTQLDDKSYRLLLNAKIAENHWNGTLPGVASVLTTLLGQGSQIFYQDNQDMTITVAAAGTTPGVIAWALVVGGYILLRPCGVSVNSYGVSSISGTPIFGLGVSNNYIAGLGTGSLMTAILPVRSL